MTTLKENLDLIEKYNLKHGNIDLQQAPRCKNCRNACHTCKFNYFIKKASGDDLNIKTSVAISN